MSERWKTVGDDFASLKDTFKKRYDQKDADPATDTDPEGPDSEDVKNALNTIGEGLERLFSSIGDVVRDDEFKSKAKATMKNLGDAISESVQEIGVKTTSRKSETRDDSGVTTEAASENSGNAESVVDDNVTTLREDLEEDGQ